MDGSTHTLLKLRVKQITQVKDVMLGIVTIYKFCQKIQQNALDRGESAAGVTSTYENAPKKLPHFLYLMVKEGRSWSIVGTQLRPVLRLMLTLQALMYIEGNNQTSRPIWKYATGALTSWKRC